MDDTDGRTEREREREREEREIQGTLSYQHDLLRSGFIASIGKYVFISISYLPNPSARVGYDTRSILSEV